MQVRRPPGLSGTPAPARSPLKRPGVVLVLVLVGALLVGLGVRTFVLRSLTVSSTSMEPTLCPGDRLLVDLWDPDLGDLTRGDLVGLPGDEVAIRDALLYVNGHRVDEPYVDHKSIDALFYGPVVVPADRFLVLGDARASSIDSRAYGPVPADRLIGTVALRMPFGEC